MSERFDVVLVLERKNQSRVFRPYNLEADTKESAVKRAFEEDSKEPRYPDLVSVNLHTIRSASGHDEFNGTI